MAPQLYETFNLQDLASVFMELLEDGWTTVFDYVEIGTGIASQRVIEGIL